MKKYFKIIITLVVTLFALFIIFRLAGFRIYRYAPAAVSMHPSISPGDRVLCKLGNYKSEDVVRGMIILISHKNYSYPITKRIITVEDDSVKIKKGKIYINDSLLNEPYAVYSKDKNLNQHIFDVDSVVVGKNELFVLGDNRNNSMDSRNSKFGLISTDAIIGKPLFILWSDDKSKIVSKP